MAKPEKNENFTVIAKNRRASFDYEILEKLEAGIVLTGSEVKSLRQGGISIKEAHAGAMQGALYLFNANIPEYKQANQFNHEPKRPRKLLIHKRQLNKFLGAVKRKGLSIIPLTLYFNHRGIVKLSIALGRGKKSTDKRLTIKDREWKRDQGRILRGKN